MNELFIVFSTITIINDNYLSDKRMHVFKHTISTRVRLGLKIEFSCILKQERLGPVSRQ